MWTGEELIMSDRARPDGLKARLRADLTAAMKARDTVTTGTLRMALTAVTNAEVAGGSARDLGDDEIVGVLTAQLRKRHEAAGIYSGAGRVELADRENAEAEVLQRYLPAQLTDQELAELVDAAIAEVASAAGEMPTGRALGQVIKAAQALASGRADGARIAAAVRRALG